MSEYAVWDLILALESMCEFALSLGYELECFRPDNGFPCYPLKPVKRVRCGLVRLLFQFRVPYFLQP